VARGPEWTILIGLIPASLVTLAMVKKSTTTSQNPAERRSGHTSVRPGPGKTLAEPKRAPADPKPAAQPDAALAIRRLQRELAVAQARIAELEATADTDFLLGVLNRRGFERELNRAMAYIRRYHATGALIVLDVDRLKPINDGFGHAAGDAVLKAVVEVLQRHVRTSDVIGRLGGDEFVLLLWNLTAADAHTKALQLEAAIDGLSFSFGGRTVSAGASAGVSWLGLDAVAAKALEQADRAMYARKAERRAGRDN
jgi:diguanylate cyclase (GGDEF)-like protein